MKCLRLLTPSIKKLVDSRNQQMSKNKSLKRNARRWNMLGRCINLRAKGSNSRERRLSSGRTLTFLCSRTLGTSTTLTTSSAKQERRGAALRRIVRIWIRLWPTVSRHVLMRIITEDLTTSPRVNHRAWRTSNQPKVKWWACRWSVKIIR